jgi:HK97 family phage portal protein
MVYMIAELINSTLVSFIPKKEISKRAASVFPFLQSFGTVNNNISVNGALSLPAFYNGVDQITNDLAKLPKAVFLKVNESSKKLADHNITFLINREPNNLMSAFIFWKMIAQSAILKGNGIAIIERDKNSAKISALHFVHPDNLNDIRLIDGELFFILKQGTFHQDDIFHVIGFSTNGVFGKGIITYAAEVLNIANLAQGFSKSGFENRGLGFGAVETDKSMDKEVKIAAELAINSKLETPGKIKTVMLDEGMKYKPITINNQEAQLIEQGKMSIADICRFLNISTHKVKVTEGLNYASLQLMNIEHVSDSIQPWIIKVQQECNRKLFSPSEKINHFTKFNDSILLRADQQTKAEYYTKGINFGFLTRNEVRAFEDLNAIDGGDEILTPVNLFTESQIQKKLKDD